MLSRPSHNTLADNLFQLYFGTVAAKCSSRILQFLPREKFSGLPKFLSFFCSYKTIVQIVSDNINDDDDLNVYLGSD